MCGIFGYVGERGDAAQVVLEGLRRLEYRGYDSWGIAVAHGAHAVIDKRAGKVGGASTALPSSRLGLGHTRWATHGAVSDDNAHPQTDCSGRLAIVHNGMVANHVELRRALARAGHRLRSQTDTELIAHVLEDALGLALPGDDQLIHATMAAFRKLHGLNAIAVLDVRSGRLAAAKSGTPLVLGFADTGHLLASDQNALLEHTRRVSYLRDGQAVLLDRRQARVFEIATGRELSPEIRLSQWELGETERGRHPDYMTKEIHEQPAALHRLADRARGRAAELASCIAASDDTFVTGCGSASYAALAAQYLFARRGRRVNALAASEFEHVVPLLNERSLVLALSQSGETLDVLNAVRAAQAASAKTAALTNVPSSSLGQLAELAFPLDVGPERCVLATKSLTAKLAFLLLSAAALEQRSAEMSEAIARSADDIAALLEGPRREQIRELAARLSVHDHLYVIGRGVEYPIALETALKIKEVSYLHAEAFAGGELKHGVMALIQVGTPCLVLAAHEATRAATLASAAQLKARGATLIGVGPEAHELFDVHLPLADAGEATLVSSVVPAQLLGYDLARLRGHDPDMPRNLAKSVTVQ